MLQLTDTHCHIQEILGDDDTEREEQSVAAKWHKAGIHDAQAVIQRAAAADVTKLLCVGCTLEDSQLAVDFVRDRPALRASIGIHPHESIRYADKPELLAAFAALVTRPGVVAVGECGLDYFYTHSPRDAQEKLLRFQIELAIEHKLPLIFHVREAFAEFWPIFDSYPGLRGVIHSFSATQVELEQILARGLYVGLNGIMTFTKHVKQLDAAKAVPLDRMLLETDAPFLTPQPFRGSICEPRHVRATAEFLAELRGESLEDIASTSSKNAHSLFGW